MTGNSAWYLLAAAGVTVLLTIGLWGMLGLSLTVCLGAGAMLCGLALVYVFALKNHRPQHYDTDYFESVLVEAGVLELAFGPRAKPPGNPFRASTSSAEAWVASAAPAQRATATVGGARGASAPGILTGEPSEGSARPSRASKAQRQEDESRTVPLASFERLQTDLATAEDLLEDALLAREDGPCD